MFKKINKIKKQIDINKIIRIIIYKFSIKQHKILKFILDWSKIIKVKTKK